MIFTPRLKGAKWEVIFKLTKKHKTICRHSCTAASKCWVRTIISAVVHNAGYTKCQRSSEATFYRATIINECHRGTHACIIRERHIVLVLRRRHVCVSRHVLHTAANDHIGLYIRDKNEYNNILYDTTFITAYLFSNRHGETRCSTAIASILGDDMSHTWSTHAQKKRTNELPIHL